MTQLRQVKNCISIFGGNRSNSWGSGRRSDAFAFCETICLTRHRQSCELVVSGMGPFFQSSAEHQEAVSGAELWSPYLLHYFQFLVLFQLVIETWISTSESLESFWGRKNKLSSWPQIRRTLYLFARMAGRQEPVGSWGQRN